MALAEFLWKSAISFCIRGPLATPNSFANATNFSRLSMAPDCINFGPASSPKILAARAAFSSALVICCKLLNISFNTSSALLSFWKPSTVSMVSTPRFLKAICASLLPSAANCINCGILFRPPFNSSNDTPAPWAANRKPCNVSTLIPVFVEASTS